jgi:tyrosine-specific transport protein
MRHRSLTGATLLITGSCVGAGMLGLPIVSGLSGFFPSFLGFVFAWAFMLIAALLFLEVNLRFGHHISFISMAEKTLGTFGKIVSWVFFLALFYALCVAYISGTSTLLVSFFKRQFDLEISNFLMNVLFTFVFGFVLFLGTIAVISFNRYLMVGLVVFYLLLVFFSFPHIEPKLLLYVNLNQVLFAIPVMIIAFGYHNMIPSLVGYFEGNRKKMIATLVTGSILAFVIYFIWQLVVLGIVPTSGIAKSLQQGEEGAQAIIQFTKEPAIITFSWGLAFFALVTSFLGQGLSLVDFFADGLKIKNNSHLLRLFLVALAVVPPLVFSIVFPHLFLKALGFGGGICATVLFGMLPAIMCLKSRKKKTKEYQVFGGVGLLLMMILCSFIIIIIELIQELG